jgi:transposase
MFSFITDIFCQIDDFIKSYDNKNCKNILPKSERQRKKPCRLSLGEIATIEIFFHMSHYRTFKDYYNACVIPYMKEYFPDLVSYNRFLELKKYVIGYLFLFLQNNRGEETGTYFVDATKLAVCHNKRIYRHKVFKGLAERGKTSVGWFFGFKLHLVINQKGEVMSFMLTPGNTDDRKPLTRLFKKLLGYAFADKGYIGEQWIEKLKEIGIKLITSRRKSMKKARINPQEKYCLSKRGLIETVIDQLKNVLQIDHTRHRSFDNFIANTLSALTAYFFKPRKPTINTHIISNHTKIIKL